MTAEVNKQLVLDFMEEAFNQGNLAAVDEHLSTNAVDYQEPAGTNFCNHLKEVITMLRTAFPDLHFEIHDLLAEGDVVSFRSTMTGTHLGLFQGAPPTGKKIAVPHMHFVQMVDGKGVALWHLWDTAGLMGQLGVVPGQQRKSA
ncbi:MAG: ester cyclase [Chloroflexota bacterium]